MELSNVVEEAVKLGAALSIALQFSKALPKSWVTFFLTDDHATQTARMQVGLFFISFGYSFYRVYSAQPMGLQSFGDFATMVVTSLTVSYALYQALLKNLADQFPKVFKV